jgi:hypothetical protein
MKPPTRFVSYERCVCGATYKKFRSGANIQEAIKRIRDRNDGEVYLSWGPILWEMRCMKTEDWFLQHYECRPEEENE